MKQYKELTSDIRSAVMEKYQRGENPRTFAAEFDIHVDLAYQLLYEGSLVETREYVPKYKNRSQEWKQAVADYYMAPHTRFETKDFFHTSDVVVSRVITEFNLPHRTQAEELIIAHTHTFGSQEEYVKHMTNSQRATCAKRYGTDNFAKTDIFKDRAAATSLKHYGVSNPMKSPEVKAKLIDVVQQRYGVNWYVQHSGYRSRNVTVSGPNKQFAKELTAAELEYETEYALDNYCFDFRVGNTLIEINPTVTHNITFEPFAKRMTSTYHRDKVGCAHKHGFDCILVWDWISFKDIIMQLRSVNLCNYNSDIVTIDYSNSPHQYLLNHNYTLVSIEPQLFYVNTKTDTAYEYLPEGHDLSANDYVLIYGAGIAEYKKIS